MTPQSACHTAHGEVSHRSSLPTSASLSNHSPKASQRIRAVPKIASAEAYRFYFAIGLTRAFAEFLRMPTGTVTLTDFMRLHALMFSAVAPWAGKLRSKHTEVVVFRRAAAASFDIRSEMRLASLQFEALMLSAKDSLDLLVAVAFIHSRIIYIQPAAEGNECAAQVLTDLQLRKIFRPIQLEPWPGDKAYATALTAAAGGDLTPLVYLINAGLRDRKVILPVGLAVQAPFDILSKNWTSRDKNLADSELLLSTARLPCGLTESAAFPDLRSLRAERGENRLTRV